MDTIFTPVKHKILADLLRREGYDQSETEFLKQGFESGFSLKYNGPRGVQRKSPNLKLNIGDKIDLWNKVMKEVQANRFLGPFPEPPFENFIQSPIGLVPKDGGTKTRLIFHLSYPKDTKLSVNSNTPKEHCSVVYPDLDDAIKICMREGRGCHVARSDITSAFRHLPIRPEDWCLLVMKAESPLDGKTYYFVDKCLPFGHTISCALFQKVSDAIAFLVRRRTQKDNVNYLDDFLFAALLKWACDGQIQAFLDICQEINLPVAPEKTFWGTTRLVFLGLLIDTVLQMVCVPLEKIQKLKRLIAYFLHKENKKVTLREMQSLCGHLNFLCRSVVPGRAFLRRLYFSTSGIKKANHHIYLKRYIKEDLLLWLHFLDHPQAYSRPFLDFTSLLTAQDITFYTDASLNKNFGAGGYCGRNWFVLRWNPKFITQCRPSISYLELYALTVGILLYTDQFKNKRLMLHCDNMAVIHMINKNSSACRNCMVLIRIIVMHSMVHNLRIFARYVKSQDNKIADALSRQQWSRFRQLTANTGMKKFPDQIPHQIWPISKIWLN